jgi:hypothetical protein
LSFFTRHFPLPQDAEKGIHHETERKSFGTIGIYDIFLGGGKLPPIGTFLDIPKFAGLSERQKNN